MSTDTKYDPRETGTDETGDTDDDGPERENGFGHSTLAKVADKTEEDGVHAETRYYKIMECARNELYEENVWRARMLTEQAVLHYGEVMNDTSVSVSTRPATTLEKGTKQIRVRKLIEVAYECASAHYYERSVQIARIAVELYDEYSKEQAANDSTNDTDV